MPAPHGVRKEEFVEPYYRRLKTAEGVASILTSVEQGRTFVSYVPRRKVPSGDANYRCLRACRKQFLHFYWYGATRGRVVNERRYSILPSHPVGSPPYSHLMYVRFAQAEE